MSRSRFLGITSGLAGAAILAFTPTASADKFYLGELDRQDGNIVLIDRGRGAIEQAAFAIDENCKSRGEPVKPAHGFAELKNGKISKNRVKVDRRIEGPSTGLNPPAYSSRTYLRGTFRRKVVDLELRTNSMERLEGDAPERCRSGVQTATLNRISRKRYEAILDREFPFFGPRP